MKKMIQFKLSYFYFFFLIFISFCSPIYFGFIGVNPIDNFTIYTSGYYVFNGQVPFKDFWVVTGPILDLTQALLFNLFSVDWLTYTIHAAFLNLIFVLITYYTFIKFGLDKASSFIYCLFLSLISYSQTGTPFVDHHATILSLIALQFLFLGVLTEKNKFWALTPFVFFLAFFSKQTPSSYFIIFSFFLILQNFITNFNLKNFFYFTFGVIFSFIILFFFLVNYGIKFEELYNQYFLFASSVGESRFNAEFLFPISFSRYILKFKLIHISYFILFYILIFNFIKKTDYIKSKDFIVIFGLILSSWSLIVHQLLTLNTKYVYLIIPVLAGFSQIYLIKYITKKTIYKNYILIFSFLFFSYYYIFYIKEKKFVISNNNIHKAIKTQIIDNKYNFKWVSTLNLNPEKELNHLKKIINFFKKKKLNYIIITDYQFLLTKSEFNKNIFINKWYHPGVSYPLPDNKNFTYFKIFLMKKIKDNNVKEIYFIKPSWFKDENKIIFKNLYGNCLTEDIYLGGDIVKFDLNDCF